MPCVPDESMPVMQGGLRGHRKLLGVDASVVTKVKCTVRFKKECFNHHGPKTFKECNLYKARPADFSALAAQIQSDAQAGRGCELMLAISIAEVPVRMQEQPLKLPPPRRSRHARSPRPSPTGSRTPSPTLSRTPRQRSP